MNTDELMRVKSDNARLLAQVEVYQNRLQTDQYLVNSIGYCSISFFKHNSIMDINSRVQRIQADKESRVETQLEVRFI